MKPLGRPGMYTTRVKFFRAARDISATGESSPVEREAFRLWAQVDDEGMGTVEDAGGRTCSNVYRIQYRMTAFLAWETNVPRIGWFVFVHGKRCVVDSVQRLPDSREIAVVARSI